MFSFFDFLVRCRPFLSVSGDEDLGGKLAVEGDPAVLDLAYDRSAALRQHGDFSVYGDPEAFEMFFEFFVGGDPDDFQLFVGRRDDYRHNALLWFKYESDFMFAFMIARRKRNVKQICEQFFMFTNFIFRIPEQYKNMLRIGCFPVSVNIDKEKLYGITCL